MEKNKKNRLSLLDHVKNQSLPAVHASLHQSEFSSNDLTRALILSASLSNVSICKVLLLSGADPNKRNPDGRHDVDTMREALTLNQSLNPLSMIQPEQAKKELKFSPLGGTALHTAIATGSEEQVKLMLEYGARCNIPNSQGYTALGMAATSTCSRNMVEMMFKIGKLSINVKDPLKGRTALHFASLSANLPTMAMLMTSGASVNIRDLNWDTPLILAAKCLRCQSGSPRETEALDAISYLLNRNAKPRLVNRAGLSALHYAVESQNTEAIQLLLDSGARVSPDLLRYACLVIEESGVVESLLKFPIDDSCLVSNLISLISGLPSKWTFSNSKVERTVHEMARQTIASIHNPSIVDFMLTEDLYKDVLFDGFGDRLKERSIAEGMMGDFGIVGYALLSGKLSIAIMLHKAGFRVRNRHQLFSLPWVQEMTKDMNAVKEVILGNCPPLKALARTCIREHLNDNILRAINKISILPPKLCAYLHFSDLLDVTPYDGIIRDDSSVLLNENYPGREQSVARHNGMFWIY